MLTCIIQARLSSTRLPGKVLRPLMGAPLLERQIERILRAKRISQVVVATSVESSDDAIERFCERLGIACVRGDLHDVLGRFVQVAQKHPSPHYARSTADCPLADPEVMDHVIAEHLRLGADYTSNTLVPTYPDGLDFEVFTAEALKIADGCLKLRSEREHVLSAMHRRSELRLHNVTTTPDRSSLRWTVDEPRDFDFVEAIYRELYEINPAFSWQDVLSLLARRPELEAINTGIRRNAGSLKETNHG